MESGLSPVRKSPVSPLKTGLRTLRTQIGPGTDPKDQYFTLIKTFCDFCDDIKSMFYMYALNYCCSPNWVCSIY